MARKSAISSNSSAIEIMRASLAPIQPPTSRQLNKIDLRFFANVFEEFSRSEWTEHQLEIAAMMARTMSDLNREQQSCAVRALLRCGRMERRLKIRGNV